MHKSEIFQKKCDKFAVFLKKPSTHHQAWVNESKVSYPSNNENFRYDIQRICSRNNQPSAAVSETRSATLEKISE